MVGPTISRNKEDMNQTAKFAEIWLVEYYESFGLDG